MPFLPGVIKEALSLMFNMVPIQEVRWAHNRCRGLSALPGKHFTSLAVGLRCLKMPDDPLVSPLPSRLPSSHLNPDRFICRQGQRLVGRIGENGKHRWPGSLPGCL